jgi:anaerobic magnesium-protoporphyrin IX monomethyl ester cyclase
MKVTLIHPPLFQNPRAMSALRPAPPLGLAYIAAALERAGHTIFVIDAYAEAPASVIQAGGVNILGLNPEAIVERINPATDVIGMTNMWSFSWPLVRSLLQLIKEKHPDKALVCGGEHFNGLAELSMETAPIDYIVCGEGEEGAVELFAAIQKKMDGEKIDLNEIPGIVWRDSDNIVINKPSRRIKSVDTIQWPAWHLFDLKTYNEYGMKTGTDYGFMVPILATRGCPYSCTFCSSPGMWTPRWYPRTPKLVVDEIEYYINTYNANTFPFQDHTSIIRKNWIVAFCQEIINRGLKISWQFPSGTRCEAIDDEVASLLNRAGCRAMSFAPESGSEETRRLIKKNMKTSNLFKAIDASVRHGVGITAYIILGFPHDTDKMVRENLKFARELAMRGVEDIGMSFYFPIPSSQLYNYLIEKGRLDTSDERLLAPLMATDWYLREENNYSEHIPAWRLTLYKYLILINFYPLSFLMHPGRIVRTIKNVLTHREESKLEVFLNNFRKHLTHKARTLFGI